MPKIVSAKEAIQAIPKGRRIFLGSGASAPLTLMQAMFENAHLFQDNEVLHLLTLGEADFVRKELRNNFRDNSLFIGPNVRKAVQEGHADFTPIFLSETPDLIRSPSFPLTAALISVTPPDLHNMCSLGVSVDVVLAAIETADIKIAEINHNMPRTFGQTFIPYDYFDYVVESNNPLPELQSPQIDPVTEQIGKNIAMLINDGAVIQTGIGAIPDAVMKNLYDKNDLGIHTEMLSDYTTELMKKGIINNKTKKIVKGRTLTSFCMGTRSLYDYVHENPLVEFYPSDFVNDPYIISQNNNMISINSALEVDLTGQVCADSIGSKFYSGIGGQVDFVRGAARSKGGKPIIALPSTAKKGNLSRIVGHLSDGAGVVTSRGDVHFIVTEYGIACLHGKPIRQRALELIQIAHPKFRDELLEFVEKNRYVMFNKSLLEKGNHYPQEYETMVTIDMKKYRLRPIKITDESKLKDFYYSFDDYKLTEHFLPRHKSITVEHIPELAKLDYEKNIAFIILEEGEFKSSIIGLGRCLSMHQEDTVEINLLIKDGFPKISMGAQLIQKLYDHARSQQIPNIHVPVSASNKDVRKALGMVCENLENWTSSKSSRDIINYYLK